MRSDDPVGELVSRYLDSSPEEKEELFARISSAIQPTIRSCVRRYNTGLKRSQRWKYKEEEDLVLETYEHIVEQGLIDRYEGRDGASFQTYIYGVARRYLLGEVRKGESIKEGGSEKIVSLEDETMETPSQGEGLSHGLGKEGDNPEINEALKGCIEALSVRERMLVALFYYYRDSSSDREMTDEDVLELLQIVDLPLKGKERPLTSIEGISTNRRRAVLRIKECLENGNFFERYS